MSSPPVRLSWLALGVALLVTGTESEGRTLEEQFNLITRSKRYLTYTYGSAIGMFLAFAVPVENLGERDVLFSYNFEANYNLPTNTSVYDLTPPDQRGASLNRSLVYQLFRNRLESFGLEGRACLLRTICEANRSPVDHNGIIGHFLQVLLSPSWSASEGLPEEETAEEEGRSGAQDCRKLYDCPVDLLGLISYHADS